MVLECSASVFNSETYLILAMLNVSTVSPHSALEAMDRVSQIT